MRGSSGRHAACCFVQARAHHYGHDGTCTARVSPGYWLRYLAKNALGSRDTMLFHLVFSMLLSDGNMRSCGARQGKARQGKAGNCQRWLRRCTATMRERYARTCGGDAVSTACEHVHMVRNSSMVNPPSLSTAPIAIPTPPDVAPPPAAATVAAATAGAVDFGRGIHFTASTCCASGGAVGAVMGGHAASCDSGVCPKKYPPIPVKMSQPRKTTVSITLRKHDALPFFRLLVACC